MTNYKLTFKLEDTSFGSKNPPLLPFSLEYSIEFSNNEIYTFQTPLHFNPKSKVLVFQEYTFGKGFAHLDLLVEQAWNIHNPLKSKITQPEEQNRAGNWLSYWHNENASDSDKQKLEIFTSWWKENFNSIIEEITLNKGEYNQQIIDRTSSYLID